ncbi:hypothetical protein ANCCAN_15946 [Ancylostoma caninum]|uniref:Uncharacterized protein n=1 Tax=Ancylostoma caninum TaxID=29170 RepID=A0A368G0Z7_ANCCA|nr:hypothetical protein ANCCAN_15946 [Ancylostoma caninum]
MSIFIKEETEGGEEGKNNNSALFSTPGYEAMSTPNLNLNPDKINSLGNLARTQQPSPFSAKSQLKSNRQKDDKAEKNIVPEGEPLLDQPNSWNQLSNPTSSSLKGEAFLPQLLDWLMYCSIITSAYTLWSFPVLVLRLGGC